MCVTCSNTDPVRTDPWLVAGSLLLRIATPLFYKWIHCDDFHEESIWEAYGTMRHSVNLFERLRSTHLPDVAAKKLDHALQMAHGVEHDFSPASMDFEICSCRLAGEIRELKAIMAQEATVAA